MRWRELPWWPWLWHMHPGARSTTSVLADLTQVPRGALGREPPALPAPWRWIATLVQESQCESQCFFLVDITASPSFSVLQPHGAGRSDSSCQLGCGGFDLPFPVANPLLIPMLGPPPSRRYPSNIPTQSWKLAQYSDRVAPFLEKLNCWNWREQSQEGEHKRDTCLACYCLISLLGFWGLEKWQCRSDLPNPNQP